MRIARVQTRSDFPHPVERTDHLWITAPDGCRLAARLWRPGGPTAPVPAILEAVPYRKGDGTAVGDESQNAYLAGHGFACLRLDLRGSGDSDGLLDDEYTEQEQDDVEFVIGWLAEQPWCNGNVGMTGVSWGGFACVQAAARTPAGAQGDRAAALHRRPLRRRRALPRRLRARARHAPVGGLDGGLPGAAARPGDRGRGVARALARAPRRARAVHRAVARPPAARRLLARRLGVRATTSGSPATSSRSAAGWTATATRCCAMLEHVPGRARGLIGPWGHTLARVGQAGAGDRLPPGARPLLRRGAARRRQRLLGRAGADRVHAGGDRAASRAARSGRAAGSRRPPGRRRRCAPGRSRSRPARRASLRGLQLCGLDAGVWCGDGGPADLPGDQRADDGASLCWDWPGRGAASSCSATRSPSSSSRPTARPPLVAVRLCDVAPDGASTLDRPRPASTSRTAKGTTGPSPWSRRADAGARSR